MCIIARYPSNKFNDHDHDNFLTNSVGSDKNDQIILMLSYQNNNTQEQWPLPSNIVQRLALHCHSLASLFSEKPASPSSLVKVTQISISKYLNFCFANNTVHSSERLKPVGVICPLKQPGAETLKQAMVLVQFLSHWTCQ